MAGFDITTAEGSDSVCYILLPEGKGFDVTFEMVPGTHFSPAAPKFDKALETLLGEGCKSPVAEQ